MPETNSMFGEFDPWGPISEALYYIQDSDLVQNVIGSAGLRVLWPEDLPPSPGNTHLIRIRRFRNPVQEAYHKLPWEQRGVFAGNALKTLWQERKFGTDSRLCLVDQLQRIGWNVDESGTLTTMDALQSEIFFVEDSAEAALQTIRGILQLATTDLLIVDNFLGKLTFKFLTELSSRGVQVRVMTTMPKKEEDKSNPREWAQETLDSQPGMKLELRYCPDFHDRFVVIDRQQVWHVGASLKDAGRRAFLISKLEVSKIVQLVSDYIEDRWESAEKVQLEQS